MKLFKRKIKDTQNTDVIAPEKTKKPQSNTHLLIGLFLCIVGIAGATALLLWSQTEALDEQQQKYTQAWTEAFLSSVKQSVELINSDAQAIAENPAVIAALHSKDEQAIQILAQQLSYRASVVDLFISPRGQAALDNQRAAPINYAALELINSAESGNNPAPEFLIADSKRYIYKATAVLDPTSKRAIGTVLVAYDAALLSTTLPNLNTNDLQISLKQKLPSAPELTIASKGQSLSSSTTQNLATAHPQWTLSLTQAAEPLTSNTNFIFSALALLIALLSSLAALFIAYFGLRTQINKDCHQFSQLLQNWQMGKSFNTESLRTPALQALAVSLSQTTAQRRNQTPAASKPEPLPAEPMSNELFDASEATPTAAILMDLHDALQADILEEDEILDIDILDEELDPFGLNQPVSSPFDLTQQSVVSGIFRAYDIRGIVDETLTSDTAYWIGRAVGAESIHQGQPAVAVARDGRLSGPELSESLIQGLVEAGCEVTDLGMVPTPVLYFATHTLPATTGVMVTGSHNPANYNGFKIVIDGETLANERITALYERIKDHELSTGSGRVEQLDILPAYLERICSDVALAKPLKIVIDCGNGVAGVIAQELFEGLGCEVVPLFCEVDGNFPNHHPDPGKPENLHQLIMTVQQQQADIGIAFDGDADRLGVVTNTGQIIFADRLMMLLAKDVVSRNPGADIIFDVKCSRRLPALISGYGGRPIMWKTGHSLMKAKLKQTGALLAGEMSGHIFYKERWYGFDDGLYSAARLLEIIALDTRTSEQIFAAFPTSHSTPELTIDVTDDSKFKIINTLLNAAQWGEGKVNTLDGVRVDYPKSWGLVRASNTTPTLVLRFEGDSQEELQAVIEIFRNQLLAIEPSLSWPF